MSEVRKLKAGQTYDVTRLEVAFWVDSDYKQVDVPGYCAWEFFEDGMFLGADDFGIQPLFWRSSVVQSQNG